MFFSSKAASRRHTLCGLSSEGQSRDRVVAERDSRGAAWEENRHNPIGDKALQAIAAFPFDKPFDKLKVLSSVEGLTDPSSVEGLRLDDASSIASLSRLALISYFLIARSS